MLPAPAPRSSSSSSSTISVSSLLRSRHHHRRQCIYSAVQNKPWQLSSVVTSDLCIGISEVLDFERNMVLRKAAAALLLLRIIENRHSFNAEAIIQGLARIRALMLKYPRLASIFAATEHVVAAVLKSACGQADRATLTILSKLQNQPLQTITNSSCVRLVLEFLRACVIKIDCALRALAPFARFRIVCSVLRRKQRFLQPHCCNTAYITNIYVYVNMHAN